MTRMQILQYICFYFLTDRPAVQPKNGLFLEAAYFRQPAQVVGPLITRAVSSLLANTEHGGIPEIHLLWSVWGPWQGAPCSVWKEFFGWLKQPTYPGDAADSPSRPVVHGALMAGVMKHAATATLDG